MPCFSCKNETDRILGSRTDSPFGYCQACEDEAKAAEDRLGRLWNMDVRETFMDDEETVSIDLHSQSYYLNGVGTLEIGIDDEVKSDEYECELSEFMEIIADELEDSRNEIYQMIDELSEV